MKLREKNPCLLLGDKGGVKYSDHEDGEKSRLYLLMPISSGLLDG